MPELYFPQYPTLVHLVGGTCRFAALNEDKNITAASVRAAAAGQKTAALLINSPGNPFGNTLSRSELEALVEVGHPIISDEVYSELCADAPSPTLLEITDDHFVIGSFSKTYAAAGLRLGYVIVPPSMADTMFAVRVSLNVCPSLPSQAMAVELLRSHDMILREHRAFLEEHRRFFARCCELHGLPLSRLPVNGLFGLVDLHDCAPNGSLEFALDLVAHANVATAPGTDFAQADGHFLRVNYATDLRSVEAGVARIRAFIEHARLRLGA
jgi:aspartate/methionine/tyrosine aminotransferase